MSEFRGRELKIIIAVLVLSGSFLFFGNVKKVSATFLNSYNKAYNGTLAASEWNNLASDFLNRDGSATMTGPLGIGTTTAPVSGLYVNGPIYATNFSGGAFTGLIDAANVMGGSGSSFGSNSGGGNYSFPASLGVGTTNPGAALHVIYPYVKTDTTRRDAFLVTTNEVSNPFQFRVQIQGDATDAGRIVNLQTTTAGLLNGGNLVFQANGGNVGIGTTAPNDTFSIGAAPAGSAGTGHNYTSTYLSSDAYALTNYGLVQTLIANATSTLVAGNLWNGTLNGNIYNGVAGAGNVGIGTTAPKDQLQIGNRTTFHDAGASWSLIENNLYFDGSNYRNIATGGGSNIILNGSAIGFRTATSGTADAIATLTEHMTILSAGDVGIGTTSPLAKLHIYSASGYGQIITEAAGGNFLTFRTTAAPASDTWTQYIDSSNGFNFYSSQSPAGTKLTINTAGNVGIGTTNPGAMLQVTKDEDGAFGAGAGIIIQNPDANGTGGASALRFMRVGATKWALVNDVDGNATDNLTFWGQGGIKAMTLQVTTGNVGIGTTVPNDTFSIGNSGAAPAGSAATGHNYTSTYLSTDDYALTNYGLVKTLIGNATSTLVAGNLWNGTLNGNIYNGTAGAGNVGIGTTAPGQQLTLSHSSGPVIKLIHSAGTTYAWSISAQNITNNALDITPSTAVGGNTFTTPVMTFKMNASTGIASVGVGTAAPDVNRLKIIGENDTSSNFSLFAGGATTLGLAVRNDGNVGVGTTAPAYKAEVNGTFKASANSSSIILDSSGNISIGL